MKHTIDMAINLVENMRKMDESLVDLKYKIDDLDKKIKELEENFENLIIPNLKLDESIFAHPECPEWANYAVVNRYGKVIVFKDRPSFKFSVDIWLSSMLKTSYKYLSVYRETNNYRVDIIERPRCICKYCKIKGE